MKTRPLRHALCWWFLALALLVAPLAHGCHGPDVDHEPLVAPLRTNTEDR